MVRLENAPGWPGIEGRWTSSAKNGVGTAHAGLSPVWFTISHGILNEVYYPRLDVAMIRDMELIVTCDDGFFSEEKRNTEHRVESISGSFPAYQLTNTCLSGRFVIQKKIITDPHRAVVLQHIKFSVAKEPRSNYHVYVLLAPHISNRGGGNTAWRGDYKGRPALMASRDESALSLLASVSLNDISAGFVGFSDGWLDLRANAKLTTCYDRAENGNVALVAEIDIDSSGGEFVLALGFGKTPEEAAHQASVSLFEDFESLLKDYLKFWSDWTKDTWCPKKKNDLHAVSKSVLKSHSGYSISGGIIASLSVPWGSSKGDDDLGGYHLIWPRDMAEAAGGFLAINANYEVRTALKYLEATQEDDGHWPQNMWTDGRKYWDGVQMDESALPILLVDLAFRKNAISLSDLRRFWPMMKKAAGFILRNGPVSQEDRWEEDPGYTPFTLAAEIAALVVAAEHSRRFKDVRLARYLLETAGTWNSNIEKWIYVSNTDFAKRLEVDGYYVRVAPADVADAGSPKDGFVPIKNRPPSEANVDAAHVISPDALALVRMGLRSARDPRLVDTVKAIDYTLRVETPRGPCWHRYNDDGYGEHEDGSPFDGTGIGRAWPLLTGERAHYELAAGRISGARKLLAAMGSFAGDGGMPPEQIWDSADIPDKELFFGKPSGSAMPLVWAHAEYLKLVRSLEEGTVFDMPPQTFKRYVEENHPAAFGSWRFNHKIKSIAAGLKLRIEVLAPAMVRWSPDKWKKVIDSSTTDSGVGLFTVDLDISRLKKGTKIFFTFFWTEPGKWEEKDFCVEVV
ncbi:MAG TPA: glycoside hydrolase family 15 protein [Candidatus Kryptonia bacterium]